MAAGREASVAIIAILVAFSFVQLPLAVNVMG